MRASLSAPITRETPIPLHRDALLGEGYWGKSIKASYGEVKQRWLIVYSQSANDRATKTVTRWLEKEEQAQHKALARLSNQPFAKELAAEQALGDFTQNQKLTRLVCSSILPVAKYTQRGRPKKEPSPTKSSTKFAERWKLTFWRKNG